MSQLNNKTSTAKKTFSILFLFAIICIGVTVGLIYGTLNMKKEFNNEHVTNLENTIDYKKEELKNKKSVAKKVKLSDKYCTNGLVIEERNISFGDIIYEYEDYVRRKLEISYVQISGLKNITIENKINEEIENYILSLRDDDELKQSDIDSIEIYASVTGNFSDVLSVSIHKSICKKTENGENNYQYEQIGLNYSLQDGEKIVFNDLFTEDASIKNIITQSLYNDMALEYAYSSETLDADMDKIDYGNIEDRIFKILAKYTQNPNLNFCFSTSQISITVNDETYTIEMADFYESIAIYTRYKSDKNLYKDESLVSDVNYVFSLWDMTDIIKDEDNKTDNFYYEILAQPLENTNEDIKNAEIAVQEKIYEKINEYAIIANRNKDKGYILSVIYYINIYEEKIGYNYTAQLYSMDRIMYDENLEEIIASTCRKEIPDLFSKAYALEEEENVFFEEEVYLNVEDFNKPIEIENITTREDRERMENNM